MNTMLSVVDHEGRHLIEEGAEETLSCWGQRGFGEGVVHELHPTIARRLVDAERQVTRTQTRMSALFDVTRRAAETVNQKIAKAFFGRGEFVRRIHRAKNVVVRHLAIKRGDEARESVFADERKNFGFIHK